MSEEILFEEALKAPAAERAALLDRACAGKPELRARLEKLLAANEQPADWMEGDAAAAATSAFVRAADLPPAATAPYEPKSHAGAVIAGKYTLVEPIGEGGMGSVWRAKQTEPVKRFVAVKLIKAGMDSKQVLARFEAERQALALMDHPSIAKVLDGGLTEDRRPFFVMELVKGVPITKYCDERKLTPKERLELFVPVCQAIQHAHQKGIIHRDVKPSNVLVALYDDKPVVKVIDFGVAKATGGALTEATIDTGFGAVVGTPEYMSPEQATFNNLDIDTRSDVYALGALLYELLTGSPPFSRKELEKKGLLEILRVVREEEPPRPSTKLSTADALPSISANRATEPTKLTGLLRNELDWMVMKALEKDRIRRYETANGFAADVQRYLAGEAVIAHPPSTAYRLKKFIRRNRPQVIAASLVLLALLAGVAGIALGLVEARKQEAEARRHERLARDEAAEKERQRRIAEGNERAATTAKEDEAKQRAKAEAAYAKAAEVLEVMVSDITGNSLARQKAITPEQKKFLTEVLKYYREFSDAKGDDERARVRAVKAAGGVGLIEHRLGRKEQSAVAFQSARDGYRALAEAFPANPYHRSGWAMCCNNLGGVMIDLGRRMEAAEQFAQAQPILEKLVAEHPTVPTFQEHLAATHTNRAQMLIEADRSADALAEMRRALAIRQKLAADHPEAANYRHEVALSRANLAVALGGVGETAEAEKEHHYAQTILQALAAEFPAEPAYRSDLALSHTTLGTQLAAQRKSAAAAAQLRLAVGLQEKLIAEYPAVSGYRYELACGHLNLGVVASDLGDVAEAEAHYRRAIANLGNLVAEDRSVPRHRHELGKTYGNLGILLNNHGRAAEALEEFRRGIAVLQALVADFGAELDYQCSLARACYNSGVCARDSRRSEDSLERFNKAIDVFTRIRHDKPDDGEAKQFLFNSYMNRADVQETLGKYAEAVKDWDRVVELSPKERQPDYRAARAPAVANAGRAAEAAAEVAELRKLPGWPPGKLYAFARVYSIASAKIADKKQEYADAAVELLRQAVKAGYKDAAQMKREKDLDPLREREDFKELLTEVEAKAEKK